MTTPRRATLARAVLATSIALGTTLAITSGALAAPDKQTIEYVLSPDHGNPEGVAWDPATQTFFTGTVVDGTIYRGTLGDETVEVWIEGSAGQAAVGMKVFDGRLYVAGGPTGTITVYDIATASVVGTFETGTGGFLNDLVVTKYGVFVTDSLRPTLWHVTPEQLAAGTGTPEAISVSAEIPYVVGFNLNGIVAYKGGRELVVVNPASASLFRIDLEITNGEVTGRSISRIESPPVAGDGLLVDRGMLVAVVGGEQALYFLDLNGRHTAASLLFTRTDPTFQRPSTLARAHNQYLVVNADFTTSTPPFTLSGLRRQ